MSVILCETYMVPGNRMTSGFGMRTHPITGAANMHNGRDLAPVPAGATGVRIYAPVRLRVRSLGFRPQLEGHYLTAWDLTRSGRYWYWGHLAEAPAWKEGQIIEPGHVIGIVGMTGAATGIHVHYEVRDLIDGVYRSVDPASALREWRVPLAPNPQAATYRAFCDLHRPARVLLYDTPRAMVITTNSVNVRSLPRLAADQVLGRLNTGWVVQVIGEIDGGDEHAGSRLWYLTDSYVLIHSAFVRHDGATR